MEMLRRGFKSPHLDLTWNPRFLVNKLIQETVCHGDGQIELLSPRVSAELDRERSTHISQTESQLHQRAAHSRVWSLILCTTFLGTIVFFQNHTKEPSSKLGSAEAWFWYASGTALLNSVVRRCMKRERTSWRTWLMGDYWALRAFVVGLIFGFGQVLGHFATDAHAIRWWQVSAFVSQFDFFI
jgi:hypothetical protein